MLFCLRKFVTKMTFYLHIMFPTFINTARSHKKKQRELQQRRRTNSKAFNFNNVYAAGRLKWRAFTM